MILEKFQDPDWFLRFPEQFGHHYLKVARSVGQRSLSRGFDADAASGIARARALSEYHFT
jgi:hypothetical protein